MHADAAAVLALVEVAHALLWRLAVEHHGDPAQAPDALETSRVIRGCFCHDEVAERGERGFVLGFVHD